MSLSLRGFRRIWDEFKIQWVNVLSRPDRVTKITVKSQSQSSESVTWPHTQSAETGPYTTAWSQNCCKQLLLRSVATKARVFVDRFWMSGPWVLSPAGTVLSLSCTGGALGWYGSGSLCRYGSEFVSAGHWFPAVCSAQPTCHAAPHWPNDAQLHLCSTPVSAPIC